MSRRFKLYLDTSVPNAYLDEKNSYRQELTIKFWSKIKEHDVFISDLVIEEISAVKDEKLRKDLLNLIENFGLLYAKSEKVKTLAELYISAEIIPAKYIEDAIHIAVTTINSLDILVSWNFEHIVKLKTKREVNAVNILYGYDPIEIIEPAMF